MELRHLRYFVTIAEERSFTHAAERLWVAQPGLSTQVRRLETELGVQLFTRHARGVELTQAGEVFLGRARTALAAADIAAATGRDLEAGMVGTVRLGLATDTRWGRTANLLARFAEEHRGVELTVLEGHGGTLWRDLLDGRLDAVLGTSDLHSPGLLATDLGTEPWVVLMDSHHRLAGSAAVDVDQLQRETIMLTGHRDGAGYDQTIAEMLDGLDVAACLQAGGPAPARLASVAAGGGVVLTTGAEPLPPGVTSRPLRPERTLAFQLLWRDQAKPPALNAFIRLAEREALNRLRSVAGLPPQAAWPAAPAA